MLDFLNAIIPNVMSKPDELFESFGQTIYMVIVSGAISMVFGLFFGIILTATAPKGVLKNKVIFNILDKLVNIFRSDSADPADPYGRRNSDRYKGCDLTAYFRNGPVLYETDRECAR